MLRFDSVLPRLPLRSLEATLDRYQSVVAPLLDEGSGQAERTAAVVKEFLTRPEWGPGLQQQLEQLNQATSPHSSWMEGFWDTMYLEIRDPIPINVNPGFVLSTKAAGAVQLPFTSERWSPQIERAASLLHAAGKYITYVRKAELPTDFGDKTTPLDMTQYPKMFSAVRIPGYSRDTWRHWWKDLKQRVHHVVVLCERQYFTISILDPRSLEPLPAAAIAQQLAQAQQLAHAQRFNSNSPSANYYHPVGMLTTLDRFTWSQLYPSLRATNGPTMDALESSLLAICLDSETPQSMTEAGQQMLHSDGRNRYFDKSIQLVVTPDGRSGVNFEHTAFDGHTILNFVEHLVNYNAQDVQEGAATSTSSGFVPPPQQLFFNLSDKLKRSIEQATLGFNDFTSSLQSSFLDYRGMGKKNIVTHSLSPDALVQLSFQLAQWRTAGKLVSTYESSMVKHFKRGRTETVRSATMEAKNFVRAFDQPDIADSEKLALLRAAVSAHVAEMKRSKVGECVDRHLQGLKWIANQQYQRQAGYEIPSLFRDEGYSRMSGNQLSTSNCGSNALDLFTFGPVIGDGLGLGYMIKDANIPINITSFQGKAHAFSSTLSRSLDDLRDFLNKQPK
jgi:carnitine O-acetyltransferase